MKRSKKILIAVIGAIAVLSATAAVRKAGSAKQAQAAAQSTAAAKVEFLQTDLVSVAAQDLQVSLPLSGSLRALNQASVKAKAPVVEEFTRDPFKPTAKDGSPNRCPRCNGFGIIPAQGV